MAKLSFMCLRPTMVCSKGFEPVGGQAGVFTASTDIKLKCSVSKIPVLRNASSMQDCIKPAG
jgi:hypothetical protein